MITLTHYEGGTGVVIITLADLAAILEEANAKPGLGVQDSAGLMDYDDREFGSIEDDYEWIRMGGA